MRDKVFQQKIERVRVMSAAWREIAPEKKRQPRLALRKLKYSQLVHPVQLPVTENLPNSRCDAMTTLALAVARKLIRKNLPG
jgi:hypothetical protein